MMDFNSNASVSGQIEWLSEFEDQARLYRVSVDYTYHRPVSSP